MPIQDRAAAPRADLLLIPKCRTIQAVLPIRHRHRKDTLIVKAEALITTIPTPPAVRVALVIRTMIPLVVAAPATRGTTLALAPLVAAAENLGPECKQVRVVHRSILTALKIKFNETPFRRGFFCAAKPDIYPLLWGRSGLAERWRILPPRSMNDPAPVYCRARNR